MCWKCGNSIENNSLIYRDDLCPVCSSPLHACKNCVYYDAGSHYDCHETVEELVKDKEAANFCDFFKVKTVFTKSSSADDKAQKAKDAFASLFGN